MPLAAVRLLRPDNKQQGIRQPCRFTTTSAPNATTITRRERVSTRLRGSRVPSAVARRSGLLHPPPIVFKGSGFYVTDSRKGSQATIAENSRWDTASEANKPKEDASSTSDGASDSKPAAAASTSDSTADSD